MCKQLAQGCYPMEKWRDPAFEPRSPGSNSKKSSSAAQIYLLFPVVLGRWRHHGLFVGGGGGEVGGSSSDVELELVLVGHVLDAESTSLAAVQRHRAELKLTRWTDVISAIILHTLVVTVLLLSLIHI